MYAAYKGMISSVDKLLKKGANKNIRCYNNKTASMYARESVKHLLQ